jgi:glycosyltransferase involved in cell wall biosynthesis
MEINAPSLTSRPRQELLSVIIPAYNAAATLGQQLDSLQAQTYEGEWEVVVVNNRSTDKTVAVVEEYQRRLAHLRLVEAYDKQSGGYARNIGVAAAAGDIFVFCDADDVAAPDWLQTLTSALQDYSFVAGAIEVESLNRAAPWRPNPYPSPANGTLNPVLGFLPHALSCNMALTREAFEAVGGFCEEYRFSQTEDIDISWRLQLQGIPIRFSSEAVMHYRYRRTLVDTCKQAALHAEGHAHLFKRFAASGMPQRSKRKMLYQYRWLVREAAYLWRMDRHHYEIWLRRASISMGRLQGSLRHRTFYL